MTVNNAFGQPVGRPVPAWRGARFPEPVALEGHRVRLEPLDGARHADALFEAFLACAASEDPAARWTYLGGMPFDDARGCRDWLEAQAASRDPSFYAIVDAAGGRATGLAAYLNIVPEHGSLEVGHLHFAPALARTAAATEAMVLMMRQAFALGYRRYEWKCDALNAPSRRAAERLGFRFEGLFRQHRVVQGRNRDTAWYAILDGDWPRLAPAFERWLVTENFDARGQQRCALGELTRAALAARNAPAD